MKCKVSISLSIVLLFVFTLATATSAWACGKSNHKKVVQYHQSKCPSNCQKECCKNSIYARCQLKIDINISTIIVLVTGP